MFTTLMQCHPSYGLFPSPPPHVSFNITLTNKNNVDCMIFETILPNASYVLSVHVLTVQQDISLSLNQQ
jgi:hypothetical protein